MEEPIDPERSETERNLWHTLDEAGWSADQIRESFAAYRDEVLREAAEKIRRGWDETRGATQAQRVMDFAADLIDPDAP